MKLPMVNALLGLALLTSFAMAQEPQATPAPVSLQTAAQVDPAAVPNATVYFYRYKQFVGSALSPSVYCDEGELARMDNGKFFVAKLASGKHVFHSNDKQAGIDVELKSGQDYYIRVEIAPGMMKGHGRLILVAPEQGSYEIKKLKQLDRDKVKDAEHVIATEVAENR
jgi:hypothetical protein